MLSHGFDWWSLFSWFGGFPFAPSIRFLPRLMANSLIYESGYPSNLMSKADSPHLSNGQPWTSNVINGNHAPHQRPPINTFNTSNAFIGNNIRSTRDDSNRKRVFPVSSEYDKDLSTRHVDNYNTNPLQNLLNLLPTTHFTLSDNTKFALNCFMWYTASSLTNNTGKQILNVFKFPVTLTFVQFALVACWCYIVASVFRVTTMRAPTREIVRTITPLAVFLIVGHVFSSISISRIPVSLAHTIKALAPLFTVLIYRFIFKVDYTSDVYISLLPLILGVILTCSFTFSNNAVGLACALGSCLVFVSQNIFSKKLLFKESKMGDRNPNKLDKLNVLLYSSSISCILMSPLWLYSDGLELLTATTNTQTDISKSRLLFYFLLNGTTNFGQNWFAFTTLSLTSPVTYSILSLVKRIFVIVMSIIWFGQHVSVSQSLGIMLTFVGLWMYQKAKLDVDRGEAKVREKNMETLPTSSLKVEERRTTLFPVPLVIKNWTSWMPWKTPSIDRESKLM